MSENQENLWILLMAQKRPHKIIPFVKQHPTTGKDIMLAMVVLTAEESSLVTAEAEKKTRKILKEDMPNKGQASYGYDELIKKCFAENILFRACKQENDLEKPFFPSVQAITQLLTVDEMGVMLNHYYDIQLKMGPIIGELTQAEADQWIKKLTDQGTEASFLLNSFSHLALKELLICMANQLKILQTSKSLDG